MAQKFSFYCRDRPYLNMSKIYKNMGLGSLSKILTETSTSAPSFAVDAVMQVSEPSIYIQRREISKGWGGEEIVPKT